MNEESDLGHFQSYLTTEPSDLKIKMLTAR